MSQRKLALVVFYALIVLLLQFRPSYDVDLFWRMKTGQLMLERGELIRTDPFTATHAGQPVATPTWGSEVVWALLYRMGSWRLLHQVNSLLFAGAFLIAALTVRRHDTSTFANSLGLSLGILVALPYCEIRPNTFAILGFALLLLVAQLETRAWRKLVLAAGVLLVWQNMHPSVMLAAVTIATRAGAGWLRLLGDRQAAKPWFPTALALLAAASAMATPMGLSIFESAAYNAQIGRRLGVSEWLPVWHPATWATGAWTVWLALAVSLVLLVRVRRRVRLEDLATLLVLGAITLPVHRLSLFFAVAMVPVWSRWITLDWFADSPVPTGDASVRPLHAAGIAAAAVLCALAVPRLLDVKLFDEQLPFAGTKRLRELGVRGVIYNYREWGGPLIWAGYPDWKVTIDGRLYLFSPEDWHRYHEIALGRIPVAQVEKWYQPDAFFLRPSYHKRFIKLLRESNNWEEAYADDADENSVVFIRRRESGESDSLPRGARQPRPCRPTGALPTAPPPPPDCGARPASRSRSRPCHPA